MSFLFKNGYNFHIERKVESFTEEPKLDIFHDYYGISFTISGRSKLIMPNTAGSLVAGTVGVIPRNIYHMTSVAKEDTCERFILKFTDEAITPLIDLIGQKAFDELYNNPVYHFIPRIQDRIYQLLCDMQYEYEHYTRESDLLMKSMLYQLFTTIMRFHKNVNEDDELTQEDGFALKAMDFVDRNYIYDPSLKAAAVYFNVSPSHFSRTFKHTMGSTYSTYLNYIKIENARHLLQTTNLSVAEIANLVGFENSNYFCNVMKKVLNCTPSSMRK